VKLRLLGRRSAEERCVLCHDQIPSSGASCPTCGVRFHRACQEGRLGCPTYGCEGKIQDLVLTASGAAGFEVVRTLVAVGLVLAVVGAVGAAGLALRAEVATRAEAERARDALVRRQVAEQEAANRQRAAEERRRDAEVIARNKAVQEEHFAREREAYERELLRKKREREAGIEAENAQRAARRRAAANTKELEQAAAGWVRTVAFRELAVHGRVPTNVPPQPGVFERLRAGEWARAEVKGSTARPDGTYFVHADAPGMAQACLFIVRGDPEKGWSLDEVAP
jgi:hypothetical protein